MILADGSALKIQRLRLGLSQAKLAELTGVSRYALSAFELGKTSLSVDDLQRIDLALRNPVSLIELVARKKRYQRHQYFRVPHQPERIARCGRTAGNIEYLHLIQKLEERRHARAERQFSAVSLFSGLGGFSLGFAWAGFAVKGFVELVPELRDIYRTNFPDSIELGGDITSISTNALEQMLSKLGHVDVLIGGPPCQGFSLSGKRNVHDPRNTLFRHYLRVVDVFEPAVAVMENVRLLTSMKSPSGQFVRDEIRAEFAGRGYRVKCFEIDARDFGVPQHRERVLFVAVKNQLSTEPSIPEPSHGVLQNLFSSRQPHRTFADACSDLPYLESGEASSQDPYHAAVAHPAHVIDWLWEVPEGCSAHENLNPNKRPPSGYNTTYKRQVWHEPASTVQTTFGMISGCRNVHPVATRSLTIREAARIQSFPDTFRLSGNLGLIRTGIGNAVPPLLAYSIGTHISTKILKFIEVSSF